MTSRYILIPAIAGIVLLTTLDAAMAQNPKTWRVKASGNSCQDNQVPHWEVSSTWQIKDNNGWRDPVDDEGYPNNCLDTVYIQNGLCVVQRGDVGGCSAVTVDVGTLYICGAGETGGECTGAQNPGTLIISHEGCFGICKDSTVNGYIIIKCVETNPGCQGTGIIRIKKSGVVQISGNGGKIITDGVPGRIEADPGVTGAVLKIVGTTTGDTSTSMTLWARTTDLEVSVKLNNRGDVLADNNSGNGPDPVLSLTDNAKIGNSTGFYRAGIGKINVDIEASGAPTWKIFHASGEINVNANCTNLSGDFILQYGKLNVAADLCTTGNLTFGGASTAQNRIHVEGGHLVTFNGSCN